jgi:hypothetical protein
MLNHFSCDPQRRLRELMNDDLFQLNSLPRELLDAILLTAECKGFIVYTVNFGNYDLLHEAPTDPSTSYICFHDGQGKVPSNWTGILIPMVSENPWLISRAFKCLPHILFPNADSSLFIDASFIFRKPAVDFVKSKCSGPFSAFQHPYRSTVEEELESCKQAGKGTYSKLVDFTKFYSNILMRSDYKLIAGGVLYREHNNQRLIMAMELWYSYLIAGVDRDQIALPVALLEARQRCSLITDNIFYNEFLIPKPHIQDSAIFRFKWYLAQGLFRCGFRHIKPRVVKVSSNQNLK